MQKKGIGISHLPNQRYRSFCRKGLNYNMMLIGSNGVGKSTFVNNLFKHDVITNNMNAYSLQQNDTENIRNPLVRFFITETPFVEKKFNINIKIIEVDNVGDQVDNTGCWTPITEYINNQYLDYYSQEKKMVKSLIQDNRVHVCLFFVEAYGEPLRTVDIKILKEASSICNVILVVGKSDIFTDDEKVIFHDEIARKLDENNIMLFEPKEGERLIYLIANPRKSTLNTDEGHLNELQELVVQKGMLDLIEQTGNYYDTFRTRKMTTDLCSLELNDDEMKVSQDFLCMMNNDEKRIDELRLEYIRKKNLYEERLRDREKTCESINEQ